MYNVNGSASKDSNTSRYLEHETEKIPRNDIDPGTGSETKLEATCACPAASLDSLCFECQETKFGNFMVHKHAKVATDFFLSERQDGQLRLKSTDPTRCPVCLFLEPYLHKYMCDRDLLKEPLSNSRVLSNVTSEIWDHDTAVFFAAFHMFEVRNEPFPCHTKDPDKIHVVPSCPSRIAGFLGPHIDKGTVDLAAVRKQLQFCEASHKVCDSSGLGPGGVIFREPHLRVIDVYSMKAVVISWDKDSYVSLSYVWGTTHTGEPLEDCQLPDKLPQTVQDAIVVTRSLGYRYLWVDRYCIPQSDGADRQEQIQAMVEIYHHSFLTIIAASGTDADHGLPGVSTPRLGQDCIRIGDYCLMAFQPAVHGLLKTKWATRGWTYQEGFFSRRHLVFMKDRVFLECQEAIFDEYLAGSSLSHASASQPSTYKELFRAFPNLYEDEAHEDDLSDDESWPQIVYERVSARIEEFSRRDLTYDGDALDAVAGVLSMYPDITFCGLPIPPVPSYRTECEPNDPGKDTIYGETDALTIALGWWGYRPQENQAR